MKRLGALVLLSLVFASSPAAQRGRRAAAPAPPPAPKAPVVDVDEAIASAASDLAERIARFKVVLMPFNGSPRSAGERQMLDQLVIACRALEKMFWRQSDPEGLDRYKALARHPSPVARDLRRYLTINGSRWDLVSLNRPFVGSTPMP